MRTTVLARYPFCGIAVIAFSIIAYLCILATTGPALAQQVKSQSVVAASSTDNNQTPSRFAARAIGAALQSDNSNRDEEKKKEENRRPDEPRRDEPERSDNSPADQNGGTTDSEKPTDQSTDTTGDGTSGPAGDNPSGGSDAADSGNEEETGNGEETETAGTGAGTDQSTDTTQDRTSTPAGNTPSSGSEAADNGNEGESGNGEESETVDTGADTDQSTDTAQEEASDPADGGPSEGSDTVDNGNENENGDGSDTADNGDVEPPPSAQATSEAVKSLLGRRARALASLASGSDWQANRRRQQLGGTDGAGGIGKAKWSGSRLGYGAAMKLGAVQTGDDNARSAPPQYDVWARVGGLYYNDDRQGDNEGRAGVIYFGADYVVNPSLLVGVHVQVDFTDDEANDINLNSDSVGWMAGPYISVGLAPNIFFDARASFGLGKTDLEFAGGGEDSFDSRRTLLSASLSGDWNVANYIVRTSAEILYLRLLQEQYTDGNGAVIGEQSVTLGRATVGAELARAYQLDDNSVLEPYVGLKGVWDFKSSDERISSGQLFGGDGLHGRVEAGATFIAANGTTVRGKAAYEGFGVNDYHAVQGSVTVIVPFN